MDRRQEIIDEVEAIKKSNLSDSEKSARIIELARELGKLELEDFNIKNKPPNYTWLLEENKRTLR